MRKKTWFPLALAGLSACSTTVVDEEAEAGPTRAALGVADDHLALTEARATEVAARAYVYAYPAVLMDLSHQAFTAVPEVNPDLAAMGAPENQFVHLRDLPDDSFEAVVRPNRDTVYSSAFLDLAQEPLVLHLPSVSGDRFTMFAMLDAWTNAFDAPGTRFNDNAESEYLIVGPDHVGTIDGFEHVITAPTNAVWLLGRVEIFDENDMAGAIAVQEGIDLRPLSAYGDPNYVPPSPVPYDTSVDRTTAPPEQITSMSDEQFFGALARLLAEQPPRGDRSILNDLHLIGIAPGEFEYDALPDHIKNGLREGRAQGQTTIDDARALMAESSDGWGPGHLVPLGDYGDLYLVRALVAQIGFGANKPGDAAYLNTEKDGDGELLDGATGSYMLRFPAGQLPPVNAFWSVSIYDKPGYFTPNPVGRYVLGSHNLQSTGAEAIHLEADGSLEIILQATPPADPSTNWLPVPAEPFEATLRMYWPQDPILNGDWSAPPIEKL